MHASIKTNGMPDKTDTGINSEIDNNIILKYIKPTFFKVGFVNNY